MRALVFDGRLEYWADYPVPEPKGGEALIRVAYAGICSTDIEITKGYMGFKGVSGHEFSGVVERCADRGLVGKRVTGEINLACGACDYCAKGLSRHCPKRTVLGIYNKDGAFADYLTLPVKNLYLIPDGISDEEAVFVEPLAAAFEILEQVEIGAGERVSVLGDGRLGLITAKVLSLSGCGILAVGKHPEKLRILDGLGIATRLGIDGLGRDYDVAVDCTGSSGGLDDALKIVKPRGTIVLKTTIAGRAGVDLNQLVIDEITLVGSRCGPFGPAIKALNEKRVDVKPFVSRIFPLERGIEAFEYASGKGILKVLIKIS